MFQIFCLAILIATSVTLSNLNEIGRYQDVGKYRGAAGWLLFVAIAAIIFHGVMICIRILYVTSKIEKNYSGYAFTVSS